MEPQQLEIREKQRKSWNDFSPGWEKWDQFTMEFLQAQADAIIESLDLSPNSRVLDIATGTGEPGLTMASIVSGGSVTAVDLSEGMLAIAEKKARLKGLLNFTTQVADVSVLPFEDDSFDAISCRLGFMFFPDMQLAAREILRVLKPGGKIAVTVWGEPSKNLWVTAMMGAIKKNIELPVPPPGAPGMFRCSQPGFITQLFREAGLSGCNESEINGEMLCSSTDEYWTFMNDVVPPVVAVFKNADEHTIASIRQEVYDLIDAKSGGAMKKIGFGARILTGYK